METPAIPDLHSMAYWQDRHQRFIEEHGNQAGFMSDEALAQFRQTKRDYEAKIDEMRLICGLQPIYTH